MEYLGYFSAILIGVSLGLIGSGGSILTVPVLVYLFAVDTVLATAYSLFIVGLSSLIGSVQYYLKGLVNVKTAIIFGIPSIVSVYLTRAFIVPIIPDTILEIGGFTLTKNAFLLELFAVLMVFASVSMIRKVKPQIETEAPQQFNYPLILTEGFLVGILTGLVGAGGGFLIIPALVLFSKLPMKEAIGTSLVIIALKSLLGFLGEHPSVQFNWIFLLTISGFAILGIFIGMFLSTKINSDKLKPAFGYFVLVMGIYILIKELFY